MTEAKLAIRRIRRVMPALREKYRVCAIGIFGSYVRGEQRKRSDLDILVDFDEVPSLLEFVDLRDYLCEVTGKKVDLVRRPALKPRIAEHVLDEAQYA